MREVRRSPREVSWKRCSERRCGGRSGEIFAQHRLEGGVTGIGGRDGSKPRRRGVGRSRDKGTEDGQRHVRVVRLGRRVEPFRHRAGPGQRAVPFAVVESEAAQLPVRQLQRQQSQSRVVPGVGCNQALEAGDRHGLSHRIAALAGGRDQLVEQRRRGRRGVGRRLVGGEVVKGSKGLHGWISLGAVSITTAPAR
jgi:hypothetical protein